MRRISSIVALAAIAWAFAGSPFSHLHGEELGHSEVRGLTHVHLATATHVAETSLVALTADEDAIDLTWNALKRIDAPFVLDCAAHVVPGTVTLPVSARVNPKNDCRANDPPLSSCRQTRAP